MTCDMWHEMCPLLKYIDICMIFDIYIYIYFPRSVGTAKKTYIYIYNMYMYTCVYV